MENLIFSAEFAIGFRGNNTEQISYGKWKILY